MSEKGILYLLPNLLSEDLSSEDFFSSKVGKVVASLDGLIAESEKSGWRFLKRFSLQKQLPIRLLNEHTKPQEVAELLVPLLNGERWGLISDGGLPCIADPGSELVACARRRGVFVEALSGPSSIFLALMLSGFPSQKFCFHGYLPKEEEELKRKLVFLEKNSFSEGMIHLWIEAPYKFSRMLSVLIKVLKDSTRICVAKDLTLKTEEVVVLSIGEWKEHPWLKEKQKVPAVFLLFSK